MAGDGKKWVSTRLPAPVYNKRAGPSNHAMRRKWKLEQRCKDRRFGRWWARMVRLGIDPAEVLRKRAEREQAERWVAA